MCFTPIDLAVDANRDGQITFDGKDVTSQDRPFRFWVNNDDDVHSGGAAGDPLANEPDSPHARPANSGDAAFANITCIRDLEDFTRLEVNAAAILTRLQDGSIQIGFKWKNVTDGSPAIKLFPAVASDLSYLYRLDPACVQVGIDPPDSDDGDIFYPNLHSYGTKLITVSGNSTT